MKQEFSPLQEKEISLGFAHGLEKHEVHVYAKKKFNYLQMREIRLGFEYGLSKKEVKKYAKKYIPFEKMKEVSASVLNVDPEEIKMETTFTEDLGADSLDLFQIIMGLEDEFDVQIEPEKTENIKTVGEAVELLKAAIETK